MLFRSRTFCSLALFGAALILAAPGWGADAPDFNRDIKPILSNTCYKCHGPDAKERKGGTKTRPLRLDTEEGAYAEYKGVIPIVPGHPESSEMIARITSKDEDEAMPPKKNGKVLTSQEIELLKTWIKQGGKYARHWSYAKLARPAIPEVLEKTWPRNGIDSFVLARLEKEGLKKQPEADPYTLVRRVSLDLTGLPPTLEEVDQFVNDKSAEAYEKLVDRLLAKPGYGEHWARMWLDLARFADSGGYASDTPRTIWAYRDYVIKAFNENKPFDRFSIEQLAGDLLPNPSEEQLIATAFHRNTMTNTEGGTTREEFRNAAIVDRVNTTMVVWMGSSFACAQCHDHKYDPIPQKDYFSMFAFLNNTEDADRADEEPTLKFFTQTQKEQRQKLEADIAGLNKIFTTPTPALLASQALWEKNFPRDIQWQMLKPATLKSSAGAAISAKEDGAVVVEPGHKTDTYTLEIPLAAKQLSALRLESLPPDASSGPAPAAKGNFVVSRLRAMLIPPGTARPSGRFVRVELPEKGAFLSLAEVQVFSENVNVALKGHASQISTDFGGDAARAIDGNTDGDYHKASSTSHTAAADNPWWEVDLKSTQPVERIVIWNRTDGGTETRLKNFRVMLLDEKRQPVWNSEVKEPPKPSVSLTTNGSRTIDFGAVHADAEKAGFNLEAVIREQAEKDEKKKEKNPKHGWALDSSDNKAHFITLLTGAPIDVPADSKLLVTIEQSSSHATYTLGHFRLEASADPRAEELSRTPVNIVQVLALAAGKRSTAQSELLTGYYLENISRELKTDRERLVALKKQQEEIKAMSVPVMRELPADKRRKTNIQFRGNYLALGDEVNEGVPQAFPPLPAGAPLNRLTLAKWLVDENNPLTPRVIANRYWEQIFGIGIVRTSEEFGSQGEPPSHPELLDWLATELQRQKWDMKSFTKLLVMSAAYRQSSKVTPELYERDPDNRLLARGPRFRMTAETVRDQALAVSGLLSPKMFGPSVKPPRPSAGLSAAFGGGLDWQTSTGEDKYRRALYTEARRTSPYPSTSTFDAPSREICTLRRVRTNTPLQALVTLNDLVYIEAAQALARRMSTAGATPRDKVRFGFRTCLARPPYDGETDRLLKLYDALHDEYSKAPKKAADMATNPIGPLPSGSDAAELAAWTTVANVLLNLDETLMKR